MYVSERKLEVSPCQPPSIWTCEWARHCERRNSLRKTETQVSDRNAYLMTGPSATLLDFMTLGWLNRFINHCYCHNTHKKKVEVKTGMHRVRQSLSRQKGGLCSKDFLLPVVYRYHAQVEHVVCTAGTNAECHNVLDCPTAWNRYYDMRTMHARSESDLW